MLIEVIEVDTNLIVLSYSMSVFMCLLLFLQLFDYYQSYSVLPFGRIAIYFFVIDCYCCLVVVVSWLKGKYKVKKGKNKVKKSICNEVSLKYQVLLATFGGSFSTMNWHVVHFKYRPVEIGEAFIISFSLLPWAWTALPDLTTFIVGSLFDSLVWNAIKTTFNEGKQKKIKQK